MVTEEEKKEIIEAAVEKALLMLPEVVGNLMANHVALAEMNTEFYKNNPELRKHKELVATTVEAIEAEHPYLDYKEILNKAVPEVKKKIKMIDKLDTETVPKSKEGLKDRKFNSDLGEI